MTGRHFIHIKTTNYWLSGLTAASIFLCVHSVANADWDITPQANTGLIYTDNVDLDPDNEEDELIFQLGVGVTAIQEGGRLTANVNYGIQGLAYVEDDRRNEVFHQLAADATLEVARQRFFIDGDSSITQQLVDPRQGGDADNIATNDNRLTVLTAGVGPRLEQQLGNSLLLRASARAGIVKELESDSDATANNVEGTENTAAASLGNIPNDFSLQWTVQYNQTRTDTDGNEETRQEQVSLNLLYPLSRTIGLIGVVGEERNSFDRNTNSQEPEGSFWEVGVSWQASPQDLIEVRKGERFFGDTTTLSWQHNSARLTGNLSYIEDVTTTTQTLTSGGGNGLTRITDEAAISKQFNAGIAYTLPRSVVNLTVFETRNEFQETLTEDRTQGVTAGWQWNLASRTRLETTLTLQHGEFNDRVDESDTITFQTQINRQLGPRTTAVLGYTHSNLDSDIADDEYQVNTLALTFNRTF